jgi:DNA-binding response OmpR family regulator
MLPSPASDAAKSLPQRVLVIDDEPAIRAVFSEVLQHPGMEVHFASSAEVALDRLRTGGFDLAIVDKNLPAMSGLNFMRVVREAQMDTDFIVVTGFASLDSAVEALRLGAIDYVHKPFKDLEQIREKVLAALERRRLARVNRSASGGSAGPEVATKSVVDVVHRMTIDGLWVENAELRADLDRLLIFLKDIEARLAPLAGRDGAESQALAKLRQELRAQIEHFGVTPPPAR